MGQEDVGDDKLRPRLLLDAGQHGELIEGAVPMNGVVRGDNRQVQDTGQRGAEGRLVEHRVEVAGRIPEQVLIGDPYRLGGVVPRSDVHVAVAMGLEEPARCIVLEEGVDRAEIVARGAHCRRNAVKRLHVERGRQREISADVVRSGTGLNVKSLRREPGWQVARHVGPGLEALIGSVPVENEVVDVTCSRRRRNGRLL